MKTYTLKTIDDFNKFKAWADKHGYRPWQYQYSYNHPEGFHTWYMAHGKEDVETITKNKDVEKAIFDWETMER